MERKQIKRFGWLPDLPDHRDFKLSAPPPQQLPPKIDLRLPTAGYKGFSKVEDQGDLGSCTANAIVGTMEYLEKRSDPTPTNLSRLFLYYEERKMEGTVDQDSGAYIRDGIKVANKIGVPAENNWPYKIEKFATLPTSGAYARSINHKALLYERMNPVLNNIRAVLASGVPFVFGFTVYENFYDTAAKTPTPMPSGEILGGHAVCAAGYDDASKLITVRNSWGEGWADKGYFYMPYDYITNNDLCDDFWVIRR